MLLSYIWHLCVDVMLLSVFVGILFDIHLTIYIVVTFLFQCLCYCILFVHLFLFDDIYLFYLYIRYDIGIWYLIFSIHSNGPVWYIVACYFIFTCYVFVDILLYLLLCWPVVFVVHLFYFMLLLCIYLTDVFVIYLFVLCCCGPFSVIQCLIMFQLTIDVGNVDLLHLCCYLIFVENW